MNIMQGLAGPICFRVCTSNCTWDYHFRMSAAPEPDSGFPPRRLTDVKIWTSVCSQNSRVTITCVAEPM